MKLLKKKLIKLRNLSSERDLRRDNNNHYKSINNNNNYNIVNANYISENDYNKIQLKELNQKQMHDIVKNVKLPSIQVKPSSSPILEECLYCIKTLEKCLNIWKKESKK